MTVVGDLVDAIAADPADDAPQLVIADLLQAEGDPRGELIMLDRADRVGALDGDPEALEQLLLLAAEYSFPRASNVEPPMLDFKRDADYTYVVEHDGERYEVRCSNAAVFVDDDGQTYRYSCTFGSGTLWTEHERDVIFTLLGDAIRAKTPLDELRLPYMTMPLPIYDGGPLRGYQLPLDFTIPRAILRNRYGLAARDYYRWHSIWERLKSASRSR